MDASMSLESINSAKLDEYEKSLPRTEDEHAASLEPLTVADFEKYNERNEKALRAEFRKVDTEIDSVKIMMHDGFSKVDQKFAAVDLKFIEVDARFDKVENRLDKLQHELRMMNARAQNQTLSRLHQSIKVVTILDERSGKELYPSKEIFPAMVKDFWNLQKNAHNMLRLLYFYDFTSWNAWSIYDRDQPDPASPAESPPELASHSSSSDSAGPSSSSDSDSPSPRITVPLLGLKKAIEKTPSMAWQEIGSILGLDIHRIEEAQREYDYFRQQTKENAQVHKRQRSAHEPTEDLALPRSSSIREPPSKRVERPFVPPKNVLTWEECCKSRSSKAKTELSEEDKLGWELDSEKFRKAHEGFHVRDYTGKERVQHAVATNPLPEQENPLEEGQTVIEKSAPPRLTPGIDPPVIANPSQNPRPQKKKATVSIRSNDNKPKNTSSNGENGSPQDSRKGKQKSPTPESWLSTQPL